MTIIDLKQYTHDEKKILLFIVSGATYDFTYDAADNLIAYSISQLNGTNKNVLTHTFTYNATGQLVTGRRTVTGQNSCQRTVVGVTDTP